MQPDLRRLLTLVQTRSAAREVYAAAVAMLGVSASVDAQTRPLGIISGTSSRDRTGRIVTAVPYATTAFPTSPISEESYLRPTTALAPRARASPRILTSASF